MGDALFVVLTILSYYFYTQGKIKLPVLTVLYILILGFSSASIFFIAGTLFFEFLSAVADKNKKQIFSIFISGTVFLTVFLLYYYWWMLPVSSGMKTYWVAAKPSNVLKVLTIFTTTKGNSNSWFIWLFVPFALLGIFSLCKFKNKIACSVALSLFFAFLASSIGYWPMTGRLWLFLPAIVLLFTPIGIGLVHDKIKCKKITGTIEFCVSSVILIFLSVNCLGYTGDKMYYPTHEINPLINYVQETIKEGEKLYLYNSETVNYRNGYNTTKIGNVTEDNVIYGENTREWGEAVLGKEVQSILKNKKTYLIFSHYKTTERKFDDGLAVLRNYGTLTEVMNVHDTLLYYFERTD